MSTHDHGNRLLGGMSPALQTVLAEAGETVDLPLGRVLVEPGQSIDCCYFVNSGLISVIAAGARGKVEVGLIGSEGCAGVSALLGADRAPHEWLVQTAGRALRLPVAPFLRLFQADPGLKARMLRYAHVLFVQASETSLSFALGSLSQRLARWLLMANDRLGGDEIHMTHEFLSVMLAVRRAGVTVALHELEGKHLIRSQRGVVTLRDREGLAREAGGFYGVAKAEYERVLGPGAAWSDGEMLPPNALHASS
ncbi:MAG: Crp/Fnr family transcriptional regulator [Proteobacteria bacterium]|nr:Crp/Fnr family transcriptional regulator [Pseudomonadota bacterium]